MTIDDQIDEILEDAFTGYVECIDKTENKLGACFPKIEQIREQIKEAINSEPRELPQQLIDYIKMLNDLVMQYSGVKDKQ